MFDSFGPFDAAAWNMTAGQNPDGFAKLLAGLGIPPPTMGGGQGTNMGMALGGPMPPAPEGFAMGMPGGGDPAFAGANDPAGTYDAAGQPAAAAGGISPQQAGGMAALGRMLQGTKQGSTDVKPQFSGGITQAARPQDMGKMQAGQQSAVAQAMMQLLQPKSPLQQVPSLGMILGGR